MPRFTGYGYKIVGSANGVVSVAPSGLGLSEAEYYQAVAQGVIAPRVQVNAPPSAPRVKISAPSAGPDTRYSQASAQPLFQLMPTTPSSSGMVTATLGVPGSSPTASASQTQMYQCPNGAIVSDPTLCQASDSGMKKYLLPIAVAVGAVVLFKLL